MSDPFIGEIRMFAGNFAPRNWAFCNGQLISIGQNDALFSLFGTIYGGDGREDFALPDLRGRIPIHAGSGTGPGLTARDTGDNGGSERVTLGATDVGGHSHTARGTGDTADTAVPTGALLGMAASEHYADQGAPPAMNAAMIGNTGASQAHNNVMPFLCVSFIVALYGTYPPRI